MQQKWNVLNDCRGLEEQDIIDKVLTSRGIDIEDDDSFFKPTKDNLLPLSAFKNIEDAYNIVMKGIENDYNFIIHADVDADGCTSGAIMYKYLKNFTDKLFLTINTGKKHGIEDYDCSVIKDKTVMIIVDSINSSYNNLLEYIDKNNYNVDIVVLDHHIVPDSFPHDKITLVSSANNYPNPELSGAGVCLKFCMYMDYNNLDYYADDLFDLAAVGLVADMVSMRNMENRYIVREGLNHVVNPAIKFIVGKYEFNSTTITYSIAPLVNAACRTNNDRLSLDLFCVDDIDEITQIINALKDCKENQEAVVANIVPIFKEQYATQKDNKVAVFIADKNELGEMAGLVANRMMEYCKKPVLVLHQEDDAYYGSARAIGVKSFINVIRQQDIIFADGHENAHGVGIKVDKLDSVINGINTFLSDVEFVDEIDIDIQLEPEQITRQLIENLKFFNRVSGQGFKPISVCVKGLKDFENKPMSKGKHMRFIKDDINFIKWNCSDDMSNKIVDVYGTLDCSYSPYSKSWSLNLIIEGIEMVNQYE